MGRHLLNRARKLFQPLMQKLQKVADEFPRKYLGYDTDAIIQERRRGLADSILSLFAVYTDLDVLLARCADEGVDLSALLVDLEQFLEIPRERKAMEVQLTRSVFLLQDVDVVDPTAVECCICLSHSLSSNDTQLTQLLEAVRSEMAKFTVAAAANKILNNHGSMAPYTQYVFTLRSPDRTGVGPQNALLAVPELHLNLRRAVRWEWLSSKHRESFEPLTKKLKQLVRPEFP
ncbi:hypothetical protein PC129_g4859 [Phytophthora cactorum]|uniref:Uncharacterized protein n=1 Tax=Phytophthora cactorum TaxID=29920 RepID=A0A329SAQ3_9STRA|nr:hypothetical protein Pcac1_g18267 [Phytophthora cactorum]KAG2838534.1 hypothetical protein PC111_g4194 [Phytophthora cactorum]KAG2844229.1 hypothetical protein PC112_g2305 [Phytophthora cactorum]KAG2864169.1 hypothetical protein PC113_g4808 [Phytophthora cactorum]KAG2919740.1 hypothetical protein PC114_g6349 [Phytophthora cactorum]